LYNKIHRTVIVTTALQTEETCQIRMSTFRYSEWNCVENILLGNKRNVFVGIVLNNFQIS